MDNPNVPVFYKILRPLRYDSSTIGSEVITVSTTDAQTDTTLNNAKDMVFDYRGNSSLVSVNSFRSGFRMKFKFRTKTVAAAATTNAKGSDSTLINNFWANLFDAFSLKVGSSDVESIPNFSVVYDARSAIESDSFRHYGSIAGFIPDEGKGDTDDPGYKKRKGLYNYTVAADTDYREVELFIPLRFMSGFCTSFNRLTTNLSYRFTLRRNGSSKNAFFGAASTTMELFLTSIQLELETFDAAPALKAEYLSAVEKTNEIDIAFTAYTSVLNAGVTGTTVTFSESQFSQARTVIVCAKDASANDKPTSNYGIYSHGDICNVVHEIQTRKYPNQQQEAEFKKNVCSAFYRDTVDAALKEHGTCGLSLLQFAKLYPFLAIDVSAQEAAPHNKPINLKTTVKRNSSDPATIDVYVIFLYERHFRIDMKRDTLTQA